MTTNDLQQLLKVAAKREQERVAAEIADAQIRELQPPIARALHIRI